MNYFEKCFCDEKFSLPGQKPEAKDNNFFQSLADVRVKYVICRVIWLLDHFIVSYNFLVDTNLCLPHLKSWDPIDQKDATFKNIESQDQTIFKDQNHEHLLTSELTQGFLHALLTQPNETY